MDLFKELKNLKNIAPDLDYLARSKKELLYRPRMTVGSLLGLRFANPRMALATLGVIGIFAFGLIRSAVPVKVAKIDPTSLKAEAQAIDIQIQLTNLNYVEIGELEKNSETTPAKITEIQNAKVSEPSLDESIEKALEELTK